MTAVSLRQPLCGVTGPQLLSVDVHAHACVGQLCKTAVVLCSLTGTVPTIMGMLAVHICRADRAGLCSALPCADIEAGQALYYESLTQTYRAVNCDDDNYGVTNRTYGWTPTPCKVRLCV